VSFQPTETDNPLLEFYAMQERAAAERDDDFVEYDRELNITLFNVRPTYPSPPPLI